MHSSNACTNPSQQPLSTQLILNPSHHTLLYPLISGHTVVLAFARGPNGVILPTESTLSPHQLTTPSHLTTLSPSYSTPPYHTLLHPLIAGHTVVLAFARGPNGVILPTESSKQVMLMDRILAIEGLSLPFLHLFLSFVP